MNFLSNLSKIVQKSKKRLGRGAGSGRGAKSGRGTTRHQRSREDIPLHFEGGQAKVVKKYPLLRGKGKNNSKRPRPVLLKLSALNVYKDDEIVDIESLIKKNIINKNFKKSVVKIVNDKELKRKVTIKKIKVSGSVKKQIEALGGKIEL